MEQMSTKIKRSIDFLSRWISNLKINEKKPNFSPTVSFIIPVFNQEKNVADYINRIFGSISGHEGFVEVIVVDNGSHDCTYEVAYATLELKRKGRPNVRVRAIKQTVRLDLVEAVKLGLRKAIGQVYVIVACDLSQSALDVLREFSLELASEGREVNLVDLRV